VAYEEQVILALLEISVFAFLAETMRGAVKRLGIPNVVGEIVAGMILGPYALGGVLDYITGYNVFTLNPYLLFLSEFSMILLVFASGLEHGVGALREAGLWGFAGAALGALLPFGASVALYSSRIGLGSSLVLGTAMGATSLAVAASVIRDLGLKGRGVNFMMAAAAADDVVDLILLSVILGFTSSSGFLGLLRTVGFYTLAWVLIFAVSVVLIPRVANRMSERYIEEMPFVVLFGLTAVMTAIGFSPVISAFIAGVSLAESLKAERIRQVTETLLSFFGSIFFVVVGAQVNLVALTIQGVELSLELTAVAMVFKVVGIIPFVYLHTRDVKESFAVSLGMTPRGETGLVVASVGQSYGLLDQQEFTAVVLMSLLTTLIGAISFRRTEKWITRGDP